MTHSRFSAKSPLTVGSRSSPSSGAARILPTCFVVRLVTSSLALVRSRCAVRYRVSSASEAGWSIDFKMHYVPAESRVKRDAFLVRTCVSTSGATKATNGRQRPARFLRAIVVRHVHWLTAPNNLRTETDWYGFRRQLQCMVVDALPMPIWVSRKLPLGMREWSPMAGVRIQRSQRGLVSKLLRAPQWGCAPQARTPLRDTCKGSLKWRGVPRRNVSRK